MPLRGRLLTLKGGLSAALVAVMLGTLTWAIIQADGFITPEPELHDAGVWVTRADQRRVGRTNTEIRTVDTSLSLPTASFDVIQSGADVLVRQFDPPMLAVVDPVLASVVPGPELPPHAEVDLGGSTGVIYDPESGGLVIARANALLGHDVRDPEQFTMQLEGPAAVTVGVDGLVHAIAVEEGTVRTLDPSGTEVARLELADLAGDVQTVSIAAVGSVPVVLDRDNRMLHLPGHGALDISHAGDMPVLQRSGPAADHALLVTESRWIAVSLHDGEAQTLLEGGEGRPAQPVAVPGCAYSAWGGNGLVARRCAGGEVESRNFEEFSGGVSLIWRVNRDRVVLNEQETGKQLFYGEGDPVFIDEWAEAFTEQPEHAEEAVEPADDPATRERDRGENRPPVARDDHVGTRPGRAVVIQPLRNDHDPDGDVLLVHLPEQLPAEVGRASVIADGQAVLFEPDPARTQPVSFPYVITDGFGHEASATIHVQIVPDDQNSPPQPLPIERTTVVTGGSVEHNVVAGALDLEGDPISLVDATTEAGDVRIEPDGRLTFTATNQPDEVEVLFTLSDDRGATATGILRVTVVDRRINQPPVARNNHAETVVGREVVVDVLANDTDPDGDPLSIVRVENLSSGTLSWDPMSPKIRFVSDSAGTHNLIYRITDGHHTAEALVRIEVIAPTEGSGPIAVRDDVLLTAGTPSFVDVLANDVHPDGDVLIVTEVSTPSPSPVRVRLLQRAIVRIEADAPLSDVVELEYRITDGTAEDTGTIVVAPAPVREKSQPPIVGPDEFTVRAGGIAILPVLANDRDPDGGPLELVPPDPVDDATAVRDGRLFMSDGQLRYEAPREPRATVVLSTTVRDTAQNTASGQLLIHVIDADGDRNSPPVAPTLIGRVLAGGRVTIAVPLATMDPEGDIVELLGISSPPRLGAVIEVGPSELVYEADTHAAGTDSFTYRVRDQFGLEATGTVLVGVAPRGTSNSDPVATDDEVDVLPGTTVLIPALANDYDPDGDPISYSTEEDEAPMPGVGEATISDGELWYTAPSTAPVGSSTSFFYAVVDGRGGRDVGTVTVRFVAELPNRPPVPMDDIIEPQVPGTTFTTAPLQANDFDPDGDPLSVVSVSHPDAELNPDGSVTMTMPEAPVQFTYVVTDGVDEARAAVIVPLARNRPPLTRLSRATVEIGDEVAIDVLANDEDPDGGELVLLDVAGVRHGDARVEGNRVIYRATDESYLGKTGFIYLVADSPDPTEALTSVGVVQVTITGTLDTPNTPPTFTQLRLDVPQAAQRTLDLAGGIIDPDEGQTHEIRDLQVGGSGVEASLSGTVLTVSASTDAAPGTVVPIDFSVHDGIDSGEGSVVVTVISSDRPLARAVPDTARTIQGQPVDIPVLDNDVNPFPDTPLTVLSVTSISGAEISTDGTIVTVAPDPDRRDLGELRFEYTIGDATGDPDREVTGSVVVTVVGRPDVPSAPTCIGGESHSVQIGWTAPSANGAEITEYVVRVTEYPPGGSSANRSFEERFPTGATVRMLTGLTNGLDYTFEVAAVNEAVVDDLEFSEPSPRCRPDQVPDKPEPPDSNFGDGELHLTFAAPPVDGSPVTSLTLRNATTGESTVLGATVTEYTWAGLENGTSYRFTLMATNDAGDSDVSELSTGDGIPAGRPLNAVAPTTEKGDRFLIVNWARPEENGDAISRYRITVIRDDVEIGKVAISDASARSTMIETDNAIAYRFRLEARNKAGWSDPSPRSAPAISAGKPFAVSSVSASEGDTNSTLTFSAPNDNGAAIIRYEVSVNGGTWSTLPSDRVVRSLTNGTNYSFRVRAVNAEGTGGASPSSNTVRPYGRPTAPTGLTSSDGGTKTITWSWNASSGNGRTIDRYEVRLNSGSWQSTGLSRSFKATVSNWGDSANLRVRAVSNAADSARRTSGEAGPRNHTTPGPSLTIKQGTKNHSSAGHVSNHGCTHSSCAYIHLDAVRLHANRTYKYLYWTSVAGNEGCWSFTTNSSGAFSGNLTTFFGFPGHQIQLRTGSCADIPVSSNTYTWPNN